MQQNAPNSPKMQAFLVTSLVTDYFTIAEQGAGVRLAGLLMMCIYIVPSKKLLHLWAGLVALRRQ